MRTHAYPHTLAKEVTGVSMYACVCCIHMHRRWKDRHGTAIARV